MLPSLDRRCSPDGCWYCTDICHNCMQPSPTMYSGVCGDNTLLKFCSEQCKGLWFHSADQKPTYAVSYMEEDSIMKLPIAPLMTILVAQDQCVDQFFLSIKDISNTHNVSSAAPFIVWHLRGLKSQYFAHFYVSKECLPIKDVWKRQICSADSEIVSNVVTSGRIQLQSNIQRHLSEAVKKYGFDSLESFVKETLKLQNSRKSVFFYGKLILI